MGEQMAKPAGGNPDGADGLVSALTTEHFVMQGAIGTSVSEQQGRASMFLMSASGALVAIGFMTQSQYLLLVTAVILSVLFLTGLLTTLRLVDIGMESLQAYVTVARIWKHYRSLSPTADRLFDPAHGRWPEGKTDSGTIIGRVLGLMTTAASMIACVNSAIGAALLTLLLFGVLRVDLAVSVVGGAAFAAAQVLGFYFYQGRRIGLVAKLATDIGLTIGDEGEEASFAAAGSGATRVSGTE